MNYNLLTKQKISKEYRILATCVVAVMLLLLMLVFAFSSTDMVFLTVVCSACFVLGLYLVIKKTKRVISFISIFYVLCYIFHCSYFYLIVSGNIVGNSRVFITLPENIQVYVMYYCILFFALFPLGTILCKNRIVPKDEKVFLNLNQCKDIGNLLMIVCIIPRVYTDYSYIIAYLRNGYLGTMSVYLNNYIIILANMFYIGCILSMFGYKNNIFKARIVLFLSSIVILLSMMSGKRGTKVVYMIAILFVYFICVDKRKRSILKILLFALLGYVFLALIVTFGDIRSSGLISLSLFVELYLKNFSYGIFMKIFSEFGYAAYTLGASIEYFNVDSYGLGKNYFLSFFEIIPNFGGVISGITDKLSFVLKLPQEYQKALGGSLLGELYYNFAFVSLIFSPILGNIFTRISFRIDSIRNKNYISKVDLLCLLIFSPALLWIRSTFSEFPRSVVWSFLIILILRNIVFRNSKK